MTHRSTLGKQLFRERQRLYLQGVCHEVPVWPELARKAWRIEL